VSKTKRRLPLIQDPGELLLREPTFPRTPGDEIHNCFERRSGRKLGILRLDHDRYPLIRREAALSRHALGSSRTITVFCTRTVFIAFIVS
jgi:hypothetical protein